MNRNKLILIFSVSFILLILSENKAGSQIWFTSKEVGSDFNRGMEFFNKQKYPSAIRLFDSYVANNGTTDVLMAEEAEYYSALSSLRLFNPDAEYRMVRYMSTHPESPRLNEARIELGDYFYQNKNYKKAVAWYNQVDKNRLDQEKLAEYYFRYGYSLYNAGDRDKAQQMFAVIKDIDTEYTPPAVYYYSQIAYEKKDYDTALEGFNRLREDETFGPVVPFYIAQIMYIRKDYDAIIAIAPDLVKSTGKDRIMELYRYIGDALYNKERYSEALPYLEKYYSGSKTSGREDKYQLAYSYYKTGDYDKAIKIFLEIGVKDDILSQNTWNVLADCYLKKGDKKRSQMAFGEASKLDFDKKIREESLFNYARLTYELDYSPFGEAIAAFQKYIDTYPQSPRVQEAYDYLVATYMQIKNYKAALESLDRIPNKDNRLGEAYQRVAFFRGLELLKNQELDASIDMFNKSLEYEKYNRQIRTRTIYWRGEAWYRLGEYEKAGADYSEFMQAPGASQLAEYKLVRYNYGYTLYNLKDYTGALNQLKTFENEAVGVNSAILADTRNRIADCYYVATNYQAAIGYYDKVISSGSPDADYALYQKGFSLGLVNNGRGKVDVLTSLITRYPSSPYVPNAIFERGRAYLVLDDYKRGEADFQTIIASYKDSPFVTRAMVQLGLLYYNLGQNDKAVAQYKKVIENYRSTPEARDALTGLKNSYVDMNDVEAYFAYVNSLGGSFDVNMSQKDSLLYTSGENLYMKANYARASEVFRSYLNEFPQGSFSQNAKFYLAECLRTDGKTDEALNLYTEVVSVPNNPFLEQSLLAASVILFEKEDYGKAFEYFGKLETAASNDENRVAALRGELRSAYQLGDAAQTITSAGKIISSGNMPDELTREATFMRAKANYSLNNFDEALRDFRKVATEVTTIEGAESKYRVAELLYRKELYNESEKVITEFIDQNTPHQYWMAKMFLLLADVSIKKGDKLQARATLQSLKDYYTKTDDGILDEAKTKLEAIGNQ